MSESPQPEYEYEDNLSDEELTPDATAFTRANGSTYIMKEDAYKEYRATAMMFFTFSIVGLLFVALNVIGIIPFIQGVFSYVVTGTMFVAFFFFGLHSLQRAKQVSTGIDAENERTRQIHTFLTDLGDLTTLDEESWSQLTDELLYFKRTQKLKELIIEHFGAMDESYLDTIVDEFYNSNL